MVYDHRVVHDGHTYEAGDDVPDFGSIECTSVEGNKRSYTGNSKDFKKLKDASLSDKYGDLATGSSALLVDLGEVHKYIKETRSWEKL